MIDFMMHVDSWPLEVEAAEAAAERGVVPLSAPFVKEGEFDHNRSDFAGNGPEERTESRGSLEHLNEFNERSSKEKPVNFKTEKRSCHSPAFRGSTRASY
ncbi:unnamed protein product [Caenorhabditis sp. 36 PRJEB53466]|nr:unnamed protein product [Caenorhabditis sp. 36 PRJEB53466]